MILTEKVMLSFWVLTVYSTLHPDGYIHFLYKVSIPGIYI